MKKDIEHIVCSAIHNPIDIDLAGNPLIYCGLRHANVLWQSKNISRDPYHQGFLTNKGRFVDRKEALTIAINAKQVNPNDIYSDMLFSEDLY